MLSWKSLLIQALALPLLLAQPTPFEAKNIQNVSSEKAVELIHKNKELVVLDIRTPSEFKKGHIANAKNIDFRAKDFKEQLALLNKDTPYLVHCKSGGRSARSLDTFEELDFKKVFHLESGYLGWKKTTSAKTP